MRKLLSWAFVLALCFPIDVIAAEIDLDAPAPKDRNVRDGTLANGFRYLLLEGAQPKARAELRLVVRVGSGDETESERGLAHFLEHMAFNGTTHYPAGKPARGHPCSLQGGDRLPHRRSRP